MQITIKQEISLEQINDLIVTALEGGSNYWYMIEKKIAPKEWTFDTFKDEGKHYIGDYPLNKGGALLFTSTEDPQEKDNTAGIKRLNLSTIKKGLEIMSAKFPKHFADVISEDTDAETGDVFLQCCLFGDVIYG